MASVDNQRRKYIKHTNKQHKIRLYYQTDVQNYCNVPYLIRGKFSCFIAQHIGSYFFGHNIGLHAGLAEKPKSIRTKFVDSVSLLNDRFLIVIMVTCGNSNGKL